MAKYTEGEIFIIENTKKGNFAFAAEIILFDFCLERFESKDHESTNKEIIWRKCWSLDLDENEENSSFEFQSHKKEKNLIGKIKKKSNNIFRSIEEDLNLNLNKGKIHLNENDVNTKDC